MESTKTIRELAEAIKDSYDDFVLGVAEYAEDRPDLKPKIREFITSTENVSTSDVIEYIDDVLDPK